MTSTERLRAELERRPRLRIASPRLDLPTGASWRSAEARVAWEAVWPPHEFDYHASPHQTVEHVLALDGANGERTVLLDRLLLGVRSDGVYAAWTDFFAFLDARYELRAAPDGHALALSSDGGRTWRYVALDAGPEPLVCVHRAWTTASPDVDVFVSAPTTRALALEIFAAASPTTPSVHRGPDSPAVNRFGRELRSAGAFACLHREDDELLRAFATALLAPDANLTSSEERPLLDCLQEIARTNAAIRAIFLSGLDTSRSERGRARAAEVLGAGHDEGAQEALARALLASGATSSQGQSLLDALTRALARITTTRRAGSAEVRRALCSVALEPYAGSTDDQGALVVRDAQANAVRGLAALASGDPSAGDVLREIAGSGCQPSPWSSSALPAWTDRLSGVNDAQGQPWSVACWAAAALQQIQRVR